MGTAVRVIQGHLAESEHPPEDVIAFTGDVSQR
jgi:hypothetical protein